MDRNFWSRFRNDGGQSALFRYESEGILVYDSHARLADESSTGSSLEQNIVPFQLLREIESTAEYDKHQYMRMKAYPSFKPNTFEYTLVAPTEATLQFDSRFESGNLRKAIKVSENEYNLLLEYDQETQGYTQWFYFAVTTYKANHKVRFNINNLTKYESLYNNGLKPLVYSSVEREWKRKGKSISYFKNQTPRTTLGWNSKVSTFYFTLTFTYTFKHPNDRVYFAHCFPYTYTDLQNDIENWKTKDSLIQVHTLCKTLAGNACPLLTITQNAHTYPWEEEFAKLQKSAAGRKMMRLREAKELAKIRTLEKIKNLKQADNEHKKKKIVILSARVHPGESNSSFMLRGAVEFLLSDCKEARILRRSYVFKIIPMLNPDGVIYGNYRCSLLGVDLNRRWKNPNLHLHPTVFYSKKLVQTLSEDSEIVMYCDLHGHSMKKNAFMYACGYKNPEFNRENIFIKMIPFYLSKTNKHFSFKDCRFRLERYKESTARIVCFKEFGILNSFTLEASFFGPEELNEHFLKIDLQALGRDLLKQLPVFTSNLLFKQKLNHLMNYFRPKPRDVPEQQTEIEHEDFSIEDAIENIAASDVSDLVFPEEDSDSCGSDSCASDNDDLKIQFFNDKKLTKVKKSSKKMQRHNSGHDTHTKSIEIKKAFSIPNRSRSQKPTQKLSRVPLLRNDDEHTRSKSTADYYYTNKACPIRKREYQGFVITSLDNKKPFKRNKNSGRYQAVMEYMKYEMKQEEARKKRLREEPMFLISNKIDKADFNKHLYF